jgi:hypothetical protein
MGQEVIPYGSGRTRQNASPDGGEVGSIVIFPGLEKADEMRI